MEYLFETAHLGVRKFTPEDAPVLYENHREEEVCKWIPNESYANPEEAEAAVRFYMDCVNQGKLPYVLAVALKETGELIGDTGVNQVEGKPDEVEIGYTICRNHSGKGYATELVQAMTEFVVSVFGVKVLFGRVLRGNEASLRVLEKNGYTLVGVESGAEDDPDGKGMLIYQKKC